MNPIYVCSKGRPDGPAFRLLQDSGLPYTVVIEPGEEAAYAGHSRRLVLPVSGAGLTYSRNAALTAADGPYWLLDDDIGGFYQRTGRKLSRVDADEALAGAEAAFAGGGYALAALDYRQLCWSATRTIALNSYCDCAVLVDAPLLKRLRLRWDERLRFKGDRDIVLQCLQLGQRVARTTEWAFAVPKNGSNAGGLADDYATVGAEEAASHLMVAKWPGVCQFQPKKDGRPDVRVKWATFKRA